MGLSVSSQEPCSLSLCGVGSLVAVPKEIKSKIRSRNQGYTLGGLEPSTRQDPMLTRVL